MRESKQVEVTLHKNILKNEEFLFNTRMKYDVKDLIISTLNNVFISHEGLCLKNFRLVSMSHFNIKGTEDNTFYFQFWKLALEQYLVSTFGKSLIKAKLVKDNYLHIYTKWFGYFFWLTDCLPKLIKTKDQHEDLRLIYPENWKNLNFVNDTLSLFPNLKHEVIPKGTHLQVNNLHLPETRSWSNGIDPKEIKMVRDFIFKKLDDLNVVTNYGDKIYINRNNAKLRKISNHNEVEQLLESQGFKSVILENYSFLEQVSILKNAKYVIGVHGAGLANAMFMKENGALLELSPQVKTASNLRIPFWRIANAVQVNYFIMFCALKNNEIVNEYDSDIIIDLILLEKNIELLKNEKVNN